MTAVTPDLPLAGVRVLDLVTGPLAAIGRYLAEWGAEVIRVEAPGGAADRRAGRSAAGVSLDFVAANLGKRATVLDLSRPGDRARFDTLLDGTDILLEDRAPGTPEAALLDVEAITRRHPALVVLSATPFGRTGPCVRWQATSPVLNALSGELSRSGIPGREPLLPPGNLPYDCGVTQAVFAVLLVYLARIRTGLGDHLDFAVLDGAVAALDPGFGIAGSATAGVPASKLPRGRPEARHQYPTHPVRRRIRADLRAVTEAVARNVRMARTPARIRRSGLREARDPVRLHHPDTCHRPAVRRSDSY
jgi:crotonobetainyl-CoA:carnitine CoA-transferase CaiB-like acyl-CoA transferase